MRHRIRCGREDYKVAGTPTPRIPPLPAGSARPRGASPRRFPAPPGGRRGCYTPLPSGGAPRPGGLALAGSSARAVGCPLRLRLRSCGGLSKKVFAVAKPRVMDDAVCYLAPVLGYTLTYPGAGLVSAR